MAQFSFVASYKGKSVDISVQQDTLDDAKLAAIPRAANLLRAPWSEHKNINLSLKQNSPN